MSWRSIASRLALWSLLGSALVITAFGLILLDRLRDQSLLAAQREGGTLAMAAANGIMAHLERAAMATQLLAQLASERAADVDQLARNAIEANDDLSGVALAWQPTPNAPTRPAPFVDRQPDGSLRQRDLIQAGPRYWEQPWFRKGITCSDGCWQQAFFSASRKQRVVNYSVAFTGHDHARGLVNVDITLEWLQGVLTTLQRPEGTVAFVVDAQGNYLAHDRSTLLGKPASPSLLDALQAHTGEPVSIAAEGPPDAHSASWLYIAPIRGTPWTLGLLVPRSQFNAQIRHLFERELALGFAALLCLALMILLVTRRTLAPLAVLTQRAEQVARGDLDFVLPRVHRRDEIGRLTRAFDTMRRQLALHIKRLTSATREQERMRSELEIAHQIQVALLPAEQYQNAQGYAFDLHAVLRPARAVGGDLYSYFMLDQQHFCVMVGDVSDKGIPAALFMARAITLAKALAPRAQRPQQLLDRLNRELCRNNDECMFVTLLCGVLDVTTGDMVLASAGHEAPILVRHGRARLFDIVTGPAIGLDEAAHYPEYPLQLKQDDTLVFYTDGVTEASNGSDAMFGIERGLDCLTRDPLPDDTQAFTRRLLREVDRFAAGNDQTDDITILALSWHPQLTKDGAMLDITLKPTVDEVFETLDRCEAALDRAGVKPPMLEDVRLVLEELLVNMVQHGYDDSSLGQIHLRVAHSAGLVDVHLDDNGTPFDPLQAPAPELPEDIADRPQIGGLGVHLIRSLASELSYSHDTNGNHLKLRFTPPAARKRP